jgi:hypothetical protein
VNGGNVLGVAKLQERITVVRVVGLRKVEAQAEVWQQRNRVTQSLLARLASTARLLV